ncbi:aromatase/cyclase [Streptomyces sp. PTD5-9]|uniref:aromatase/cyclase n=1 Tax=Streptomyces sp. PTD5-9 TaxID=3120150 RepID=UPI003008B3B8
MPQQSPREVEHEITVRAPAEEVYRLLAEVANWPRLFPPTVYVDHLEKNGDEERIQIWATANGRPKKWTSRRRLDPGNLRIAFAQEVSAPPVAHMSGTWILEPHDESRCRVRLLHAYGSVDDDPAGLAWIDEAVDRNSRTELAALKANVELAAHADDLTLSFEDRVSVDGSAKDVYDFIDQAQLWTERLPHVSDVRLTEEAPGIQTLRMDTTAKDGSTHTTESVRVCFPYHGIAYKQTTLPALLSLHTGFWRFEEGDDGVCTAVSQHTVVVNERNIARILGPDAGVQEARAFLREALGTNSRATLAHAREFAEGLR